MTILPQTGAGPIRTGLYSVALVLTCLLTSGCADLPFTAPLLPQAEVRIQAFSPDTLTVDQPHQTVTAEIEVMNAVDFTAKEVTVKYYDKKDKELPLTAAYQVTLVIPGYTGDDVHGSHTAELNVTMTTQKVLDRAEQKNIDRMKAEVIIAGRDFNHHDITVTGYVPLMFD
jgi:hypothetical protein